MAVASGGTGGGERRRGERAEVRRCRARCGRERGGAAAVDARWRRGVLAVAAAWSRGCARTQSGGSIQAEEREHGRGGSRGEEKGVRLTHGARGKVK